MIHFQNSYADLVSNVFSCQFDRKFPAGSRFSCMKIKSRDYWYAFLPDGKRRYLGPDREEMRRAIESERDAAVLDRENAAIIKSLIGAGVPQPGLNIGKTIEDLSWNGFFRLRGVLVGTLAFQAYHAVFGVTPKELANEGLSACGFENDHIRKIAGSQFAARTSDIDQSQFRSISLAIDDSLEKALTNILSESGGFEQITGFLPGENLPKWRNKRTGLLVDLLTPFVSKEHEETDYLPTFSAHAVKLKFLDFLIYDELHAVLIHKSGVPINIPQPARYAVHKMIISRERRDVEKQQKDVLQALALGGYLLRNDTQTMRDAFSEAYDRGPGWRKRLDNFLSLQFIPEKIKSELSAIG